MYVPDDPPPPEAPKRMQQRTATISTIAAMTINAMSAFVPELSERERGRSLPHLRDIHDARLVVNVHTTTSGMGRLRHTQQRRQQQESKQEGLDTMQQQRLNGTHRFLLCDEKTTSRGRSPLAM